MIRARRLVPHGYVDLARQLVLFALAYYAYSVVRSAISGQESAAFANARAVVDLERGLGLFFEPQLQHWAAGHQWLVTASDWVYLNSQLVVTTSFLAWLYFARNRCFYYVRNMFMIAMAIALVCYVAFPTAPPRLMPEWGFTDTVASFAGQGTATSASVLFNPYAAVPSMHVAFALMIAVPAMRVVRAPMLRALWALYPLLITFVVMVTANHFWLDAALGTLTAAVSASAAHAGLARARPDVWSWRTPLEAKATA